LELLTDTYISSASDSSVRITPTTFHRDIKVSNKDKLKCPTVSKVDYVTITAESGKTLQ